MKFINLYKNIYNKEDGSVAIITAVVLFFVLIGIAALAIDIGKVATTKNELQNVADAAALAGAGKLGEIYYSQHNLGDDYDCDEDCIGEIVTTARNIATKNKADGASITILNSDDIQIGEWTSNNGFKTNGDFHNAVYVKARRDDIENNPITTFFSRIFNINEINVSADAVAALTALSSVAPGTMQLPIGLSRNVFPDNCGDEIVFSPTTDSCAGWHNFFDKIDGNEMEDKLLGFIQGHKDDTLDDGSIWLKNNFTILQNKTPTATETPAVVVGGSKFEFQGGDITSLFNGAYINDPNYDGNIASIIEGNPNNPAPFIALFDYFRYRDDDLNNDVWTTTIPVYKDDPLGCDNPNGKIEIVGFANVVVIEVKGPPNKSLKVDLDCELTLIEGRGGGSDFGSGLMGIIPNLVE